MLWSPPDCWFTLSPTWSAGKWGVAKCVFCCRRMGRAGTSNRWWDSRCGCGHSASQVRVCAPPDEEFAGLLAGAGVPLVPVGQSGARWCAAQSRRRRTRPGARPSWSPRSSTRSPRRPRDVTLLVASGVTGRGRARGRWPRNWASATCTRPSVRSCCRRRTTRRRRRCGRAGRCRRRRPTTGRCGTWTPRCATRCSARCSTPTGRRSACHRWTTSATTSSPITRGWRRTRPWPRGRSRRISTSCRPARGSCPTNARSRPSWRRSWTPAHRRCTSASAACPCAPRRTSPGSPSRRSARRAAAYSSPAAGPTWP